MEDELFFSRLPVYFKKLWPCASSVESTSATSTGGRCLEVIHVTFKQVGIIFLIFFFFFDSVIFVVIVCFTVNILEPIKVTITNPKCIHISSCCGGCSVPNHIL